MNLYTLDMKSNFKVSKYLMAIFITLFSFAQNPAIANEEVGVTKNEIVLGATFPQTGALSPFYQDFFKGAQAYFSYLNKNGGIYGRKIRLILKDDGGLPTRAVQSTQSLILQDKVFALFNSAPVVPTHVAMVKTNGINRLQIPNLAVTAEFSGFSEAANYPTTFQIAPNAKQEFRVLTEYISKNFNSITFNVTFAPDDTAAEFEAVQREGGMKFVNMGSPSPVCPYFPYPTDKFGVLSLWRQNSCPSVTTLTKSDLYPLVLRGKSVSSSVVTDLVANSNSKNIFANFNMPLFTDEEDPFISFFTKVIKEEFPGLDFSKQYSASSRSVFNHVSQQLYEGANAAYVVSQAISAIGSKPTRANLISFLRNNSKSLSSAIFNPLDYSSTKNVGDTVQFIAKFDGAKWVKVSEYFLVNQNATSIQVITPQRNPLLPSGLPVAKPIELTEKKISCIKGKTIKVLTGANPKCPKGYKQK
jgi:ABC-type branched-subunit amino acid transport system substrate-binding protein